MKNTFAVSMALLLALTLGGSFLGYRIATAEHNAAEGGKAEAPSPATEASAAAASGGAATGGETGQQPAETSAAAAAAPSGDAEAGKELFAGKCAGCHGANAAGGIGPTLVAANGPTSWTDAEFHTALRELKTPARALKAPMMAFPADQLTDSDITNIHEYLKTLN